jgi:hypothetical protein
MSEGETLVRSTHKASEVIAARRPGYVEALDLRVAECMALAVMPLSPAQELVVKLRCGVYHDGTPLSMTQVGEALGGFGFRSVSRQRAHATYRKALALMGAKAAQCLAAKFPSIAVASLYDLRDGPSQKSLARIKGYFFQRVELETIQYAEVMRRFGADIPKKRKRLAAAYSEEESCWAFYEDFGIRRFGMNYKICTRCPKSQALRPIGEFYRYATGVWMSMCIECNSAMCRERKLRLKPQKRK